MRVLFIASGGDETLMIEREITLLQQQAILAAGEDVTFHFLPDITVEQLPLELSRHKPDVLHISAHGTKEGIRFVNSSGDAVMLSPENLLSLLHPEHPPRLIYLNDCDSSAIAKRMIGRVEMAVGSTAPITNRAAMSAAVLFYDRLIGGFSVRQAFDAAQAMIRAIHAESASAELFARPGVAVEWERLHQVPRIIAQLKKSAYKGSDYYGFELALMGARHDTVQVVFFTDDETFINDEDTMEDDLCLVVRGSPTKGVMWSEFDWSSYGDFCIHACATTSAGQSYAVSTMLCEAIEDKLLFVDRLTAEEFPEGERAAIDALRAEDGSRLAVRTQPRRARKRKPGKKGKGKGRPKAARGGAKQ